MDPYSYDLVTRQREALQASLDATAEVLLGEAFERVRAHLREQLSRRDLTMPEVEVDDLAIAISQGGQRVLGAGIVEEIRIHDPESCEYDHRVSPGSRRTWWQRLRREPAQRERYIFDGAGCPDHGDWRQGRDWQAMPRSRLSLGRRRGRTPSWKAFARGISAL